MKKVCATEISTTCYKFIVRVKIKFAKGRFFVFDYFLKGHLYTGVLGGLCLKTPAIASFNQHIGARGASYD
jgi:hypothetical protein